MRISKVLLRRFKSFNGNFSADSERRADTPKPWNSKEFDDLAAEYGFIEIPIEEDVTTVVGANESGKSHLLSAISMVLTGKSGGSQHAREYSRTDLCHFVFDGNQNATIWPEIGLELSEINDGDWAGFRKIAPFENVTASTQLTIIVKSDGQDKAAEVFVQGVQFPLTEKQLSDLRKVLPRVRFIDARLPINDHVEIGQLIGAYEGLTEAIPQWFSFNAAQRAARAIVQLPSLQPTQAIDAGSAQSLSSVKAELADASMWSKSDPELEVLLFRDVLGIELETLTLLANLPVEDRSYTDSIVASWNRRLDERLNLSRYWQQDDQFNLRINFKQGALFFEITDKTGAVYTFRERSSGLRYFMSYYIQAKAIELAEDKPGVILMDEPDSFLSVVGQRNLLSIFESLVGPDSSKQSTQLIYATHSPFLLNRNFPRRIRLVRKGDGEEGTQYVDAARIRRYEPVRSALGIDCAQTMFMGATNLLLEGAVDQFLVSEFCRLFADRARPHAVLDLNDIVVTSAESATRVAKVLDASLWEDEPNPAVVVLLDSDAEGDGVRDVLIGKARGSRKRIEPEFVKQIATLLGSEIDSQKIVTTEDLAPSSLYARAIKRWLKLYSTAPQTAWAPLDDRGFGATGLQDATTQFFRTLESRTEGSYDKLGVAEQLVEVVREEIKAGTNAETIAQLKARVLKLCAGLQEVIADSRAVQKKDSTRQGVIRHLRLFLSQHSQGSSLFDLQRLVKRLQAEIEALGREDLPIGPILLKWQEEVASSRSAGTERVEGEAWKAVATILRVLQHDPFADSTPHELLSNGPAVEQPQPRAEAAAVANARPQ